MRIIKRLMFGGAPAALALFLAGTASAQDAGGQSVSANQPKPATSAAKTILVPAMTDFRKAGIGTTTDDLKKAWGKPELEDRDGFLYDLADGQTAQVAIDGDGKVTAIAVTFRDGTGAPKAEEVFGPNEKIEVKEDGALFHMVRYPDAGYWVSYSSQGSGKPVILMFKKI
jgi:hypothetical protein